MITVLLFCSSSPSALFVWQSLVTFLALPFRVCRQGTAKSVRGSTHNRLHASFVLAMAVVLACVIVAPTVAGVLEQ